MRISKLMKLSVIIIGVLLIGLVYGYLISEKELFPYNNLRQMYQSLSQAKKGPWSIGIYTGVSPFSLKDSEEYSNPIIKAEDATDTEGIFAADPFLIENDGKYFIYFELLNRKTGQGDIAYAESQDLRNWDYKKIVIDEPFHLSYPYVFEWGEEHYMIPESGDDYTVRLYKSSAFPQKWEYIGNLLEGFKYRDPSIFRFNNKWWMFVNYPDNDGLHLFFSDSLFNGWKLHPQSPIMVMNKKYARSAGRVFNYNGNLYRLAQDCDDYYGKQVFCFEISELTDSTYIEKKAQHNPLVTKTDMGWNANGMHHIDLHEINGQWVGIVDGQIRMY